MIKAERPLGVLLVVSSLWACRSAWGAEPGHPRFLAESGDLIEPSSKAKTIVLAPGGERGVVVGTPGQTAVRLFRRLDSDDSSSSEVVGEPGVGFVSEPVIADVNGDGLEDILLVGGQFGGVVILLQDGLGGFQPAPQSPLPTPELPRKLAFGDFDADGVIDIALLADQLLVVYHGMRGGLFGFPEQIDVGDLLGSDLLVAGQVDGNGGDELVVQTDATSELRVVSRDSESGGYAVVDRFTLRDGVVSIHIADFEGDGDQDIIGIGSRGVVWAQVAERVESVFFVRDSQSATDLDVVPSGLVDDLDGDGILDAVVTTRVGSHIFYGRLDSQVPAFEVPPETPLPIAEVSETQDLTGDGIGDLLYIAADRWYVFPNDGRRFRNAPLSYDLGDNSAATQVIPAPWTDQGNPVFLVNDFDQFRMRRLVFETTELGTTGSDSIDPSLLAKGDSYRFADLNGDQMPDLIRVKGTTFGVPTVVRYRIATGPGAFLAARDVQSSFLSVEAWVPVDLNGDGAMDVVLAGNQDGQVEIMLGSASGLVGFPESLGVSGNVRSIAAGDTDGDGIEDLTLFVDAGLEVIYGDKQGGFGDRKQFNFSTGVIPARVDGLAVSDDLNGDGLADLVWFGFPAGSSTGIRVLPARPGRQFDSEAQFLSQPSQGEMIRSVDLNDDGRDELLALVSERALIYGLDSAGRFRLVEQVPLRSDSGLEAVDVNGDGLLDLVTVQRETVGVFFATGGFACRADLFPDGRLDFLDLGVFLNLLLEQNTLADLTQNGVVDFLDLGFLLESFSRGCPDSNDP